MPNVLMGLYATKPDSIDDGIILFYVPLPNHETTGFDNFQRDTQYSWTSQERLSRDPAMQFTGRGEETITVEGKTYPYHFGGLSTLKLLRDAASAGRPYILARFYTVQNPKAYVSEVIGNFVIKRIRTVESKIGRIGIAHKVDFTIEMTRYGDDDITQIPEGNLTGVAAPVSVGGEDT